MANPNQNKTINLSIKTSLEFSSMKRRRCRSCKHTMKGHKKKLCLRKSTLELPDGVYEGSLYDGRPCGEGRLTCADRTYFGEFSEGKKEGYGVEIETNGTTYKGQWASNKFHGRGSLTKSDGSIYEGTFYCGKLHGNANIKTKTHTYIGGMCHGSYHGTGELVFERGTYTGQFLYGLQHGTGRMTYKNGDIYLGQWKRGLRSGIGTLSALDWTYTGHWSRDMRSGNGRFVSEVSGIYEGYWKRDLRHNQGIQTYKDGVTYVGGWSRGRKTGHGVQEWPNGDKYTGFWMNDLYNGRGLLNISGHTYVGEWETGAREGLFVETLSSGKTLTGTWRNDVRHGIFKDENSKKTMYIWGASVHFDTLAKARESLIEFISRDDLEAAVIVAEFFPKILSWAFVFKHDSDGILLHFVSRDKLSAWGSRYGWHLFREGRYTFINNMMSQLDPENLLHLHSKVPELFDVLSCEFVANPWIINKQSYSDSTKQRLLSGLHLGEFGRCPPKDPFTRQAIDESSGTYLCNMKSARSVYARYMSGICQHASVGELAYQFDLEDIESAIRNARESKDIGTLRALMKEREDFIRHRGRYAP